MSAKSLAYLIPGILHAVDSERPFIISSHTITLQQIRNKDLKICEQLFHAVPELSRYAHFKTALMLGKGNYCCSTRLSNALKDAKSAQTELLPDEGKQDLIRLAKWSAETKSGMVQELAASATGRLGHRQCRQFHLLAQKLRCSGLLLSACPQATDERQLCNRQSQPLVLADQRRHATQRRRRGILLADDFVVLDEAHRIPAIATDHFGIHVSSYAVDRASSACSTRAPGAAARKHGQQWDFAAVENAIHGAGEFFASLKELFLSKQSIRRIHEPDFCENILSGPLKEVAERLGKIIQDSDDERAQDELRDHRRRILGYQDTINGFIRLAEDDHVHWLERSGKKGQIVTLRSALLDVSPYLREALFSRSTAAVLTSATLSDEQPSTTSNKKSVGKRPGHSSNRHLSTTSRIAAC